MRYRLRTLMILLAVLPPLLAGLLYVAGYFQLSTNEPGVVDRFFPNKRFYDIYQPMIRLEEIATGRNVRAGYSTAGEKPPPAP